MTVGQIKSVRDTRISRALWASARGAEAQAQRNFDAAERLTRAYFALLRIERERGRQAA